MSINEGSRNDPGKRGRLRLALLLLPGALSLYWLQELGALGTGMKYVLPGSDYYVGVLVGKLMQAHGGGVPAHLTEFRFPDGFEKASIAEYFFETLWQIWMWIGLLMKAEPIRIMWWGAIVSTLANIWGTWALLWTRWGKYHPTAAVIGWSVILLNSWAWMRAPDHWFLSWVPIYLWAVLLWWDFFSGRERPPAWKIGLAHLLLLAQSVYFGIFQSFLVAFWSLISVKRLGREPAFRKAWLALAAAMALGYALSSAVMIQRIGGFEGLKVATHSTERPLDHAYWYSFRMRELLRGGEGSPWNWVAQRAWKQKAEVFSKEGEGYPSPWPKLLFLACAVWLWIARRKDGKQRLTLEDWSEADRRGARYAWAALGFLLLLGLQETFFFRKLLIHPWLPQIRSYARLLLPIYMMSGVLAILHWKRIKQAAGALVLALLLLFADFGPPARAKSWRDVPVCQDGLSAIAGRPGPILFQEVFAADWKRDLPEHEDGCAKMFQDSYAFNGFPYVDAMRGAYLASLLPGTQECEAMRARMEKARLAYPTGRVLWWYQGPEAAFESSRQCFAGVGATQGEALFELPLAGGKAVAHLISFGPK